jgi:hypothetical protein
LTQDQPHAASDPAGSFPGRVAIVGNDPALGDVAEALGPADHVVRFNNAAGFGGRAGSRVTHLALVNRGGQMRAWLDDPRFLDRPALRAAGAIILPFPALAPAQEAAERICWTREAQACLRGLGVPITVLPQGLHDRARAALRPWCAGEPNPSTGFLVAFHVLARRAEETAPGTATPVEVHGFGFAGWPGHPWAAERRWFEAAHAAGRVRLHPPGGPGGR